MNRDTQVFMLAYRIAESKHNKGPVASHAEIMEEAKAIEGLGKVEYLPIEEIQKALECMNMTREYHRRAIDRFCGFKAGHTIRATDINI